MYLVTYVFLLNSHNIVRCCAASVQANPDATGVLQPGVAKTNLVEVDLGFIHAFLASISVIIVSELGDKTFFIAAILSMRNPRVTVFAGAMLALGLMTIFSGITILYHQSPQCGYQCGCSLIYSIL